MKACIFTLLLYLKPNEKARENAFVSERIYVFSLGFQKTIPKNTVNTGIRSPLICAN